MTQHEGPGSETFPLGAVERAQLGRSFAVLVPVAVLAGVAAVLLFPRQTGIAVVVALVALVALAVVLVLLVRLPCFLTRQGVRTDAAGLILFAEPRWWFRGWRFLLPPASITAVTPLRSHGRAVLSITVAEPTPGGGPVWCTAVPPGVTPVDGQPADDHRLLVQLPEAELDQVAAAVERLARPSAARPLPTSTWVSVRLGPVVTWGLASLVGLAATQLPLWSLVAAGTASGWTDPVLIVMITLAVLALLVVIGFAPSALARQGIEVGPDGLELRRDRLGWQPGSRWRIPWAELRGLSGVFADPGPLIDPDDQRTSNRGPATVLELILNQSPAPPPLPGWVRVVPPGVEARRVVADRPRLMIKAGDPRTADQLRHLLSRRVPEGELDDSEPLVRTVRWIALPRRGLASMIIAAVALILVGAGWLGSGLRPFANAPLWQDLLWPLVPVLAGAGLAGLVGWVLPARLARGGVQVEPAGIQLVRERFLWRAELRCRLPWSGIGEVRVVRVFAPGGLPHGAPFAQAVELTLITAEPDRLPHWAVPRDARRLLVHTGDAGAARMISAIADVRPAD